METLKDRLLLVIEKMGVTKAQFEKRAGLSNGFVDKCGDNTRRTSLDKISNTYPMINISWLLTGEGEMLNTDSSVPIAVRTPAGEADATLVLLLPVSAQGGSLNDFVVSVKENDCEKVVSPIRSVDFAMTVSGDSMAPEYPNGSRIFVKKINEKAFIEWGKAYVLDTCNGSIIKILTPSEQEGHVRCLSINPDPVYAPFDVAMCDIYGIYKVLLCMSTK